MIIPPFIHIFADVVIAFKESLKKIDWMDEKSAKAAAEKVLDACFF